MLSFFIKHFICLLIFVGLDKLVNFLNYSPLCKHIVVPWLLLRFSAVIFRVLVTNIFLYGFLCVYPAWAFLSSFVLWVDVFNWIWGRCGRCFFRHVFLPRLGSWASRRLGQRPPRVVFSVTQALSPTFLLCFCLAHFYWHLSTCTRLFPPQCV